MNFENYPEIMNFPGTPGIMEMVTFYLLFFFFLTYMWLSLHGNMKTFVYATVTNMLTYHFSLNEM